MKVPCKRCGTQILMFTSDRTSGFCMPCYKRRARRATEGNEVGLGGVLTSRQLGLIAGLALLLGALLTLYYYFGMDNAQSECRQMCTAQGKYSVMTPTSEPNMAPALLTPSGSPCSCASEPTE